VHFEQNPPQNPPQSTRRSSISGGRGGGLSIPRATLQPPGNFVDGTQAALPEGIGHTRPRGARSGLLRQIHPKSKGARRRDLGTEECHCHVRKSVQEAHRILAA
jgi:hypothetical protein